MNFMFPVPEASVPAKLICSERSAAGMMISANEHCECITCYIGGIIGLSRVICEKLQPAITFSSNHKPYSYLNKGKLSMDKFEKYGYTQIFLLPDSW